MIKTIFLSIVLLMTTNLLSAQDLSLPLIFSDHMVLQRDAEVRVWGWAKAGSEVEISFGDITKKTVTDNEGNWEAFLPSQKAGGPYEITISSAENQITLQDVYFGDVWLAGGQSNMEWKLGWKVDNWQEEVTNSGQYPDIRFFEVPQHATYSPEKDVTGGEWRVASPENAENFSAVAWHFAKLNHNEKGVPVGIIESNWGGTPAEAWTPAERLLTVNGYEDRAAEVLDINKNWKHEFAENAKNEELKWQLVGSAEIGLKKGVHGIDYDDSGWELISIPTEKPVKDIVWFRRKFTVDEQNIETVRLFSGDVVQESFFYLNGEEVGTKSWQEPHTVFDVNPDFIKPGENVLAFRAVNSWDNQVMVGGNTNIAIVINEKQTDLTGSWRYSNTIEPEIPKVTRHEFRPGFLYNGMIHPITGYTLKGAIWYQGESNVGENQYYHELFSAMIDEWREKWNQGEFPFLYVQLANYLQKKDQPAESDWAKLREAQTLTLNVPNTGMATTIDIGEADDIHPRNKQDVGKRLWLAAEKVAFGNNDIVYSGPVYNNMVVDGDKVLVSFLHVGSGLMTKPKDKLLGFAIAGEDQKFHWANARIEGKKVVLWADEVKKPVAVRYAWADNPDATLYNKEGLPAVPFRTDDW